MTALLGIPDRPVLPIELEKADVPVFVAPRCQPKNVKAQLSNPSENPVRFRQIAERAIAVDAVMQIEEKGWQEQHAQLLAYYRLNLQNLDKLAVGDVS